MSTMTCQGFEAVIEYDDEAELFHGEVVNLRDVVVFQGTSVAGLKQAFAESIEDYRALCRERGEAPEAPSGTLVRYESLADLPFAPPLSTTEAEQLAGADDEPIWPTRAQQAFNVAQAKQLREQAEAGGLRFEAYLTPRDAVWMLGLVEEEVFIDPSDAIFAIVGEARELHPHKDLRQELLKRMLQASIDDPRPSVPVDDVFARLKAEILKPLPEPAQWQKFLHGKETN